MKLIKNLPKLLVIFILFAFPQPVSAQSWTPECIYQPEQDVATFQGLECLVARFLNIAISLIGVAIFFMLILGSYKLMTSSGDPKNVDIGKQIITNALIGLIVAISSWFIISFISTLTGSQWVTTFNTQVRN